MCWLRVRKCAYQIAASRSTIVQGSPTASLTCITADKTQEYRALPRASKACDMSASESCNVNTCGASFCCYCDTSGCYLEPCSVHKSDLHDPCLCRAGGGYPHPLQVHYLLSSSYGADCKATVRFLFRDDEAAQAAGRREELYELQPEHPAAGVWAPAGDIDTLTDALSGVQLVGGTTWTVASGSTSGQLEVQWDPHPLGRAAAQFGAAAGGCCCSGRAAQPSLRRG